MSRSSVVIAIFAGLLAGAACGGSVPQTATNANRPPAPPAAASTGPAPAEATITREAFEKEKARFAKDARDLGRKIGSGPDDLWLWTKVRASLAAERDLKDAMVTVDVELGVVTLNGTVSSMMAKLRAESITGGIAGVKDVTNLLKVGSANAPANANR